MEEYTNYIAHHGIKGMKWGVRRFQNKDGSLTLRGRLRYGLRPISNHPDKLKSKILEDVKKHNAKIKAREVSAERKKQAKLKIEEARKQAQIRLEETRKQKEHDRKMSTPYGASKESVNSSLDELRTMTEKYNAAADYMDARSRIEKHIDAYAPKEAPRKTKLERAGDTLEKVAKVAGEAKKIYEAYNAVFGNKQNNQTQAPSKTMSAMQYLTRDQKNIVRDIETNEERAKKLVKSMNDVQLDEVITRTEKEQKFINAYLGRDDKLYRKK